MWSSCSTAAAIELEFDRDVATSPPFDSTDDAVEFITTKFGPMIMAKQMTEASGRWAELRAELAALYERDEPAEYLVTRRTEGGAMSLGSRLFAAMYDAMSKGPEEAGLQAHARGSSCPASPAAWSRSAPARDATSTSTETASIADAHRA